MESQFQYQISPLNLFGPVNQYAVNPVTLYVLP